MKHVCFFLVLSSITAIGCFEEEDSCNVRTPGIYVEYEVSEQGENAAVQATFWVGDDPGGTYLELGACGDTISVNGTKLHESGGNPTRYTGNVSATGEYEFVLNRPEEGAYSSVAYSDGPLLMTAPVGSPISRDDDIMVEWSDPSSGQIHLSLQSSCFESVYEIVTNDGEYVIAAEALQMYPYYCTQICTAHVDLIRYFYGDISPSLKGTLRGDVRAASYFDSTPATGEVPYTPDTDSGNP
ncbi:MAG: hypothetical protein JXX29_17470 [Deltaproteobacteria bacterium]|nr:hypothetical protein [Deltaproteobacteria bacterium]MBN2673474.1 hypothetical protein [Deltaproteobacteria bacterium]